MKTTFRRLAPGFLFDYYRRYRLRLEQRKNQSKTIEEVFTDIYTENKWGGVNGEVCSGSGTSDERIVSPYISMISTKAISEGFQGYRFVDLGCGDFRVGRQLVPLCSHYTGVDIVEPVIAMLHKEFGNQSIDFRHLNIVDDNLPEGDVCFVRQVLQHLSNNQIAAVLPKLKIYKYVFITEHYPEDNNHIIPNKDKVHGADIRIYENSAVYLSESPFGLPEQSIEIVLEVSAGDLGRASKRGIIRTFLYKP